MVERRGRDAHVRAGGFVDSCRIAVDRGEPVEAIRELVARAVADPASIERAFGPASRWENQTLYASPTLTVQKIWWAPGTVAPPHDHRMWAVIGVYAGREDNAFFRRSDAGLVPAGGVEHRAGAAIALDADVIHSVVNPLGQFTAAIHVYGGDIVGAARSFWMPPRHVEAPAGWPAVERLMAAFNERQAREPTPWDPARAVPILMEILPTLRR